MHIDSVNFVGYGCALETVRMNNVLKNCEFQLNYLPDGIVLKRLE